MIDLQTILTYLTLISVPIGVFYHIMTLRNTRKNQQLQLETRQTQLFMNLYETWRNVQYRKQWLELMHLKWTDWEDFRGKYGLYSGEAHPELLTFQSQMSFFDGIGVLVKKGLIDIGYVHELLYTTIMWTWEKNQPLVEGFRRVVTPWEDHLRVVRVETGEEIYPEIYKNFEYLYDELMNYIEEHPELAT